MSVYNYLGGVKGRIFHGIKKTLSRLNNTIHPGTSVLLYHRVTRIKHDPEKLCVSPENFELQMSHLKNSGKLLTIDQFMKIIASELTFPPNSFIVTFDDGYVDNFTEALPILERLGIQALFFISTANINTDTEFWWDNLQRMYLSDEKNNKALLYRKLHKILKPLPANIRDAKVNELLACNNIVMARGREHYRTMNEDEIRRLARSSSACIGAHTHNHVMLSALSPNDQREEMSKSKKILEKITGKDVPYFAFPFGGFDDFTAESIHLAKDNQFLLAFANTPGLIKKGSDLFNLPRNLVRDWSVSDFKKNIY